MKDTLAWCIAAAFFAFVTATLIFVWINLDADAPAKTAMHRGRPVRDWLDDLRTLDPATRQEALEALGSMEEANRDAIPELIRALEDDNHLVRAGAARALGRIGPAARDSIPALEAASMESRRVDLREIIEARGRIEGRPSASAGSQSNP